MSSETTKQKNIGGFLFGAGLLTAVIGLIIGTTAVFQVVFGSPVETSQWWAGVLCGSGFAITLFGLITSIPEKSLFEFKGSIVGLGIALAGVVLFMVQFPARWNMYIVSSIGLITFTYLIGMMILFTISYHAMINFRLKSQQKHTITHRIEKDSGDNEQTGSTGTSGIGIIGKKVPDLRSKNDK